MKSQSYLPKVFVAAVGLLLLGALGAYWPQWVQASPNSAPFVPNTLIGDAIMGDAITYQGYLTDAEEMPLSGTFTMRFEIYNAPSDGDLLWDSSDTDIPVADGLFEARLAIDTDIFNGEELWIAQTINGELLTPRQEILPAPVAHTLRPGAIIKGTANAFPNNYLFDVQMNNDAFAFNRGAIFGQSTTGNAIYGQANNGRAIYGQTQDGYAVYGFDGGSMANRGYAGYFYSTNGVGVYGYSNGDRSHPNIYAPGVYGQSNRGVGVYGRGDTSNSFSFYNEGGYFEGGKGLYARGTDTAAEQGYGARIFSDDYRGMYVRGNNSEYDAYFGGQGGINVDHVVERNAARTIVANTGAEPIEPGDLVAMAGVVPSPVTQEPMLAVVKMNGTNTMAVIGVAAAAISVESVTTEDGTRREFAESTGSIEQDGFLTIVTDGLAPAVNLSSINSASALNRSNSQWDIGSRIVLASNIGTERSSAEPDEIFIGRVAGPADTVNGTVPLFIDID